MQKQRYQNRQPKFPALFCLFHHSVRPLRIDDCSTILWPAIESSPIGPIISHIAWPNNCALRSSLRGHPGNGAAFSRMMKQVLLRVPAVFSEVGFTKGAELCCGYFSFSRKVFLFQDALDPDVDWKRPQPLVGKEHHTTSNLCAHARQFTQMGPQ